MTTNVVRLNTVGVLAEKLNQPISRVQYVLNTRPHISPVAVAGRSRLYEEQAVAQLRYEFNCIDAKNSRATSNDC